FRAHLAARVGAERAGTVAGRGPAGRDRAGHGRGARRGERLGTAPAPRTARLRPADRAPEPRRPRLVRRPHGLRRDGARALRGLLVGVALRARRRSEDDRRGGGRDAARPGRAPDALPLLLRTPEGARGRARAAGAGRGGGPLPAPLPDTGAWADRRAGAAAQPGARSGGPAGGRRAAGAGRARAGGGGPVGGGGAGGRGRGAAGGGGGGRPGLLSGSSNCVTSIFIL